jgi:hypothetical protein
MQTVVRSIGVDPRMLIAATIVVVALLASASSLLAQGIGSLSQLFGGSQQAGHSSQASQTQSIVTVERGAAPYVGEFTRKANSRSGTHSFSGRLACYPAQDPALAQSDTFVCYAVQSPTD